MIIDHIEQCSYLLLNESCYPPVKKIISISQELNNDEVGMKLPSVNSIVIIQPFKFCQAYFYFFTVDKYL